MVIFSITMEEVVIMVVLLSHKWDWQVLLCVIYVSCAFPGKRAIGNVNNVVTFVCDKWMCKMNNIVIQSECICTNIHTPIYIHHA